MVFSIATFKSKLNEEKDFTFQLLIYLIIWYKMPKYILQLYWL